MTERLRDEHGRFIHLEQVDPDPDATVIIDAEIVEEGDGHLGELVVAEQVDPYPILTSVVSELFDEYDRSKPVLQRSVEALDRVEIIRAMFEAGNIYPDLKQPILEDAMIKFDLGAVHG
jgi:hypothetical protein